MKKSITTLCLALFAGNAQSQVKDISFTIAPFAEYTFWDNKSGLNDGALVGGKLGFGLGEYIELRAVYAQSLDLKTNFNDFGIPNFSENGFTSRDLKLTRWGGEFKANLGRGRFNPYIAIGTGVQNIEIENSVDFDQIYANLALGIKTKLTDRIVFTFEAKNTAFNFNAGKELLTDADKINFGLTDNDFSNEGLYNWSLNAGLQFYLGGRRPGTLTDLDKAYLNKFKGGFKGLQIIFEPSVNYIAFDNDSNFKDTYLIGGYVGLDFNEYIGLRGFFFRPTQDDQLSTNLDRFSMYGMEFRARLNDGNGVTPYLVLGGGYLNTMNGYEGKNGSNLDGQEFASAGLGLNIPVSRSILISGGIRGMVTSGTDINNLSSPESLQSHTMYNLGLKFSFGKSAKNPTAVYNEKMNEVVSYQKEQNDQVLSELKEGYQTKLDSLQTQLGLAKSNNDVDKAVEVLQQKKETVEAMEEVRNVEVISRKTIVRPSAKDSLQVNEETPKTVKYRSIETQIDSTNATQPQELIKMTPAELEMLIDRILEATDPASDEKIDAKEIKLLNKRMETLESNFKKNTTSKSTEPVKASKKVTIDAQSGEVTTEVKKADSTKVEKTVQKANIMKDSINSK